ncbi:MAG TPA: hypothetical protein DEQ14_05255 [Treponema sp.]|nr:hypothetical protein [Treponema sp.]
MKYKILSAVCLLSAFSLFSCSRASGRLLILEGNFLSSRHKLNEAMMSYNKALARERVSPYAESGLAAVYHSLDENKAAREHIENSQKQLTAFPQTEHRELRYRNNFNLGVILFADGNFSEAAAAFRDALRVDSTRLEAKRNLELCLLSIDREKTGTGQAEETQEATASRAALFEYFGQKEQSRWKSREWTDEEENTGPDY